MTEDAPALSIRNTSVVAPDGSTILRDVDLEIPAGEHVAILGPNGSGKSSLIKLITHHLRPTTAVSGARVTVFGRSNWNVFDLRSLLGIVSADLSRVLTSGFPPLPAREVVVSGHFGTRGLFGHQEVAPELVASAEAALASCGVLHLADRTVPTLSTGEVRRVLLARSLAPRPRALILDEPTTGLDLVAREEYLAVLAELASAGLTIILVTHHVEEILPAIRRVVLLKQGRVAADGAKEETLTSERLSGAFDAAIEVERRPDGFYRARVR